MHAEVDCFGFIRLAGDKEKTAKKDSTEGPP